MSPRVLAVVLLRSSGVISIVVGLVHLLAYIPLIGDLLGADIRHPAGPASVFRSLFLPSLAGIIGGLVLVIFAGSLARIVTRGLE